LSSSENFIGKKQEEIIEKVSRYIKESLKRNKSISLSDYYYFNSWAENFGKKKLRKIINIKQNFLDKLRLNLKLIFRKTLLETQKYLVQNNYDNKKNYKTLVVTYCDISNLSKDKIYDRFFSSYISQSQNTLWLLINLGSKIHKPNAEEDLVCISREKKSLFTKIKFLILFIVNLISYIFLGENLFFKENLIKVATKKIENIFLENKINRVILPFESQPLQHAILKKVKILNKKIQTIGYLHSALPPLPTDFIFKGDPPDILLVHGSEQKSILTKKLGWPENVVSLTKSFRYQKKKQDIFLNKIFLPYSFNNLSLLVTKFEKLFDINSLDLFPTFEIINHPYMINSRKHKNLINFLKKKMQSLKNRNHELKKNNCSIFFGATASILETLEHDVSAIQICSEPIFESHSSKIWSSLQVIQLDTNIFKYELIKKESIIEFGKKADFLKKFSIYQN